MWVKATYTKKSICKCGFTVLKDEVPIGTEYHVVPSPSYPVIFECGGCGGAQTVKAIEVAEGNGSGLLPAEIFTISKEKVKPNHERHEA